MRVHVFGGQFFVVQAAALKIKNAVRVVKMVTVTGLKYTDVVR